MSTVAHSGKKYGVNGSDIIVSCDFQSEAGAM
jgi:hypothetical protein